MLFVFIWRNYQINLYFVDQIRKKIGENFSIFEFHAGYNFGSAFQLYIFLFMGIVFAFYNRVLLIQFWLWLLFNYSLCDQRHDIHVSPLEFQNIYSRVAQIMAFNVVLWDWNCIIFPFMKLTRCNGVFITIFCLCFCPLLLWVPLYIVLYSSLIFASCEYFHE